MESTCAASGAKLVSIHDKGTDDAVAGTTLKVVFFLYGSEFLSLNGWWYGWIPLCGQSGAFTWSDGTPFDYTNFSPNSTYWCPSSASVCYAAISARDGGNGALRGQWVLYEDPGFIINFICSHPVYS